MQNLNKELLKLRSMGFNERKQPVSIMLVPSALKNIERSIAGYNKEFSTNMARGDFLAICHLALFGDEPIEIVREKVDTSGLDPTFYCMGCGHKYAKHFVAVCPDCGQPSEKYEI